MKKIALASIAILSALLMMTVSSFAATPNGKVMLYGWMNDGTGLRWEMLTGGTPRNGWRWINDNFGEVSRCYYFDKDGYVLTNTVTPDGYTVNEKGEWVVDGIVQTHKYIPDLGQDMVPDKNPIAHGVEGVSPVTNGRTVPKLELNMDILSRLGVPNSVSTFSDARKIYENIGQYGDGDVYLATYRGDEVRIFTGEQNDMSFGSKGNYPDLRNGAKRITCPVKDLFTNFPEQGMSYASFLINTGFFNHAYTEQERLSGYEPDVSTHKFDGNPVWYFGMPEGNYNILSGFGSKEYGNIALPENVGEALYYTILLTKVDNRFYIYPDSLVWIY